MNIIDSAKNRTEEKLMGVDTIPDGEALGSSAETDGARDVLGKETQRLGQ